MVLDTQPIKMSETLNAPSSASSDSDSIEQKECIDDPFSAIIVNVRPTDAASECCPASPTTVPVKSNRSNSSGSQVRSPKPRRQRTTSVNQNTISSNEAIIRSNNRTIYTAGRPPWYNCAGQQVEPFVIGICGGSASGKTTVAQKIIESLDVPWVTLLSMDCFYRILNEKQHLQANLNEYNFDHPDAFDIELMKDVLQRLKEGRKVEVPVYNFVTHSRETHTKTMYGANVIIFEGILVFHNPEILKMLDMKIFVDTDSDIRLARRLKRDIQQRGRDLEGVLKQYSTMVKPAYSNYIAPTMAHADIIVPRGSSNVVAIQLIVQHVHTQLQLRGFKLREALAHSYIGQPMPDSLKLLPTTPQLYYLRLPKDIKDYRVILMDATVATGAAAIMAIRVLLDHDVPEENIMLVSLLMAEIGVHSIAYAFPKVQIVTSALDPEINEKFYVIPGIGNFGDRYFGTEPTDGEVLYEPRTSYGDRAFLICCSEAKLT